MRALEVDVGIPCSFCLGSSAAQVLRWHVSGSRKRKKIGSKWRMDLWNKCALPASWSGSVGWTWFFPMAREDAGSIPGQGIYLYYGFGLQFRSIWKETHWCFSSHSLSLCPFLPPPSSSLSCVFPNCNKDVGGQKLISIVLYYLFIV